jgi:hypothetical protein
LDPSHQTFDTSMLLLEVHPSCKIRMDVRQELDHVEFVLFYYKNRKGIYQHLLKLIHSNQYQYSKKKQDMFRTNSIVLFTSIVEAFLIYKLSEKFLGGGWNG